jgi:hypothetical protein
MFISYSQHGSPSLSPPFFSLLSTLLLSPLFLPLSSLLSKRLREDYPRSSMGEGTYVPCVVWCTFNVSMRSVWCAYSAWCGVVWCGVVWCGVVYVQCVVWCTYSAWCGVVYVQYVCMCISWYVECVLWLV